jgi:hypothetical protein
MKNRKLLAAACLVGASAPALAGSFDINNLQNVDQQQFHELAQDLGAALSYKPLEPAEALGVGGFDIGAVLTATTLENTADVQKAMSGTVYSTLPVPTVRATLGLPYHMDFGAMYSRVPNSGINLWGADLKWAVLPGDVALPAVALRASVTRLDGVSQMGFETIGADVSISKGFLNLTPYGGVGEVWSRSSTNGLNLAQENLTQTKVFAGLGINLVVCDLTFEADTTGGIRSYSGKIGFRF